MTKGYFVTGTDTGVGKSLVSAALIHAFVNQGLRVSGMKPVASGGVKTVQGLRNVDAELLQLTSNVENEYVTLNPYCFLQPIAPHLAAEKEGIDISIEHIVKCFQRLQTSSDVVIVEGAGGWQLPLNASQSLPDLSKKIELPVIIVVGARLGCINHALLTAESILTGGQQLAGWVFNQIDPGLQETEAVKNSLQSRMPCPMIADIPWQENPDPLVLASNFLFPS